MAAQFLLLVLCRSCFWFLNWNAFQPMLLSQETIIVQDHLFVFCVCFFFTFQWLDSTFTGIKVNVLEYEWGISENKKSWWIDRVDQRRMCWKFKKSPSVHTRSRVCTEGGVGGYWELRWCLQEWQKVTVCSWSWCKKVPQTGWCKQQKCIILEFWRPEVWGQTVSRAGSSQWDEGECVPRPPLASEVCLKSWVFLS